MQRLSGIALAGYLFLHFYVLSSSLEGDAAFNSRLALVQTTFFKFGEIVLLGIVAFHLLNGIRIMLVDVAVLTRSQRQLLWGVLGLLALFLAVTAYVILGRVFAAA